MPEDTFRLYSWVLHTCPQTEYTGNVYTTPRVQAVVASGTRASAITKYQEELPQHIQQDSIIHSIFEEYPEQKINLRTLLSQLRAPHH